MRARRAASKGTRVGLGQRARIARAPEGRLRAEFVRLPLSAGERFNPWESRPRVVWPAGI
jgi:hypothetical protein